MNFWINLYVTINKLHRKKFCNWTWQKKKVTYGDYEDDFDYLNYWNCEQQQTPSIIHNVLLSPAEIQQLKPMMIGNLIYN